MAEAPKKSTTSLQLAPSTKAVAPPSPVLPPMQLTGQFGGPLKDTAIQRFVDPETGVVCYLYTPYTVSTARNEHGQLVYNANTIGNISCVAPWKQGNPPAQR